MSKLDDGQRYTRPKSHIRIRFAAAVHAAYFSAFGWSAAAAGEPADLFQTAASGPAQIVDHSGWSRLLKSYVRLGADGLNRVDYAAFKSSGHGELKLYIRRLEAVDPGTLDRPEQFAFLANLYNAKTIDIVLDQYPVNSIKDISLGGGLFATFSGGPWKAKVLRVQGLGLSLDDIEHGILRPLFNDPRVHYSVNCASIGCPNLQTEAFTGGKLSAQLDAAAKAYVNHPRGVTFGPTGLVVSSIYVWFKSDFEGSDDGVLQHLRSYATPALAEKLKSVTSISEHVYDWRLNDARR
jgi:hypothetical protein